MKFSLLMSIYHKEKPAYFNRCMQSIWDDQTIKPDEIVLVEDGKLTDALYMIIKQWQEKIGDSFKIIALKKNLGTGDAKNIGLQSCQYALIAIMDTDDIAMPYRFEKQLDIFKAKDIDVCSAWISEFDTDESQVTAYRKLPELHEDIIKFATYRMPVNHPATMYKKTIASYAGGYKKMIWFEDYYLMIRMMRNGARFYNIQEALVHMRAGNEQLERRSGWRYVWHEFIFQKALLRIQFINRFEFIKNVSIRTTARLIPKSFLKLIYRKLRD